MATFSSLVSVVQVAVKVCWFGAHPKGIVMSVVFVYSQHTKVVHVFYLSCENERHMVIVAVAVQEQQLPMAHTN